MWISKVWQILVPCKLICYALKIKRRTNNGIVGFPQWKFSLLWLALAKVRKCIIIFVSYMLKPQMGLLFYMHGLKLL